MTRKGFLLALLSAPLAALRALRPRRIVPTWSPAYGPCMEYAAAMDHVWSLDHATGQWSYKGQRCVQVWPRTSDTADEASRLGCFVGTRFVVPRSPFIAGSEGPATFNIGGKIDAEFVQ